MYDRIALLCDALKDEATIIKRGTERLANIEGDPETAFTIERIRLDSVSHAQKLILDISEIIAGEAKINTETATGKTSSSKNEADMTS